MFISEHGKGYEKPGVEPQRLSTLIANFLATPAAKPSRPPNVMLFIPFNAVGMTKKWSHVVWGAHGLNISSLGHTP